jgi:WD40 repeat protein
MSPDALRFAVRLGASMVGLFSTSTLRQEATFSPGPKTITALAWSPDGHWLAVGGYSGLLQLWNIAGAPRLMRSFAGFQPILGQPEAVQSIAFSPDGRLIAATADSVALTGPGEFIHFVDNRLANVAVWRAGNGQLTVPPVNLGTGTSGTSDVIAFSRNGKLLAVSLLYGPDQLLDPSTGKVRRTLRRLGGNTTVSLAFSRDSILATGTQGGIVQLWNPYSGEQVAGATAVAAVPVTGIAFDPTGQRFATTGGQDGTVKLWFAPTLRQEGTALATEQGAAATAAFEPNGTNLLVVDDHGDAFTWPMSLAAWEQHACAIAGRNLTRKEWARFVTGRSYSTVCP